MPAVFDTIFKAYDVRGKVPAEWGGDEARRIGAGFADFAADAGQVDGGIAVGWDCRLTTPALVDALVDGITARGVDVEKLGLVTTDMIYFVAGDAGRPGVMVTASHNPKEYNGLKFCLAGAAPVGADSGLAEVRRHAEAFDPAAPVADRGSVWERDPKPGYVDHVLSIIEPDHLRDIKVAADGGNGMAGVVLPTVFDRIAPELVPLYMEPDGDFPNHHPDPLRPENLEDLLALMRRSGVDLGVAFDGDADRAFFVDDQLHPLPGSTTTAIIARWFLEREPGASIVHNLICSRAVPESVASAGGTPVRTRVGHSFIKEVMKETGAVFGGEHSGHYYFRDNFRADSGILATLVLLQVLSEDGRSLSVLRQDYEPYEQSGEINLAVEAKQEAIEAVASAYADAGIDRLDGLTVSWPDRWFNLRPSNTEPVLRLNVEGPDREAVSHLVDGVRQVVESHGGDVA